MNQAELIGQCPHALAKRDATALIGITAVLEGHIIAGILDEDLAAQLTDWLGRRVRPDARDDLLGVLDDLNRSQRAALGESDA